MKICDFILNEPSGNNVPTLFDDVWQLIQDFGLFNILNSPTIQFRRNFGLFSQFFSNFSGKKTRFFDTGYRFGAHPTPIF